MDLVTGQRTFYKGVSGLFATTHGLFEVPFTDSAGNVINCSYIRVTANYGVEGNNTIGAWVAELSGVAHEGNMDDMGFSALNATVPDKGICGFGGTMGYGTGSDHSWHARNGEVATGIKIQVNNELGWAAFGITYGNLYGLNRLRLEESYDAGV